jgi:hypothetical protein
MMMEGKKKEVEEGEGREEKVELEDEAEGLLYLPITDYKK